VTLIYTCIVLVYGALYFSSDLRSVSVLNNVLNPMVIRMQQVLFSGSDLVVPYFFPQNTLELIFFLVLVDML
jgi:hypothetical protein